MLIYAARRLAGLLPLMAAVVLIVFLASRAMPGDPVATMLSDHSADKVMADRLRAEYGLDQPLAVDLGHYVIGLLHGDLGLSYRHLHVRVVDVLAQGAGVSLTLAVLALAVALPLGVVMGVVASVRRDRWRDDALMALASAAMSVPNFALQEPTPSRAA